MSGATVEEVQIQEALLFSETIKGLKTLRSQLYSAAEYFELAYTQQDEKQAVTNNLKEYAVKALVNTVDHLGSISFKVSSLIDQRFSEATDADLRISCIHQRTQASQACVDREGISQQSLVITAPKYHKRYILPAQGQSMPSAMPNFREMNKVVVTGRASQMHQVFSAAETRAKEKKQPSLRKLQSIARLPSQRARSASPAQRAHPMAPAKNATPTNRDKRSESPVPSTAPAPLTRSASLSKKASLLKTSSVRAQAAVSQPKKLAPMRTQVDRSDDSKDGERTPKKSKKFLKSILSRRKSRKDEPLPSYFDDY
ncbi:protein ABIL1 isoform X2 [Zea mays]|uniref:Protein ABIL1 n=1 Tax=Zea mays TaxID=4577 RepID=A0A804NIC0_MAIZE|nr:protein ABIL1 isoform X2 [Zea mays]|eukprot:XP_020405363.1 protein ABIL1 isoform X2 [Zea mays]